MTIKNAFIKSLIFSQEYLKDFSSGHIRAQQKYGEYLKETNKDILWKQRKLPLDFFLKSNSGNYYDSLSHYFLPYNMGFHFKNGTQETKKYCKSLSESSSSEKEETLVLMMDFITNDIIKMNYYMEKHKLQYKKVEEISKVFHFIGDKKTNYLKHEHFLFCIKIYYTKIFPLLANIEKIISFNGQDLTQASEYDRDKFKVCLYHIEQAFEEIQNFGMHDYDTWLETFQ